MAIPENQLETWSNIGSVVQSAATYEIIRNALNDPGSSYSKRSFTIFLQGSYGNSTNVFRDSDVDIVIRLNDAFYYNNDSLSAVARENFNRHFVAATYGFEEFKAEVIAWLVIKFGEAVRVGGKAISIAGDGNRRDADVLVSSQFRRYGSESDGNDDRYHNGIMFINAGGHRIENYPKQHSENCTAKNQSTNGQFKPLVRVYKNIRNRMLDDGLLRSGVAPSYFIEGMLWNVPNENFGGSLSGSFASTYRWILNCNKSELTCASGLHWLVRDNSNVSWPSNNMDSFLSGVAGFWDGWAQ